MGSGVHLNIHDVSVAVFTTGAGQQRGRLMEAERSSIGSFYRPESYNSSNRSSRRTSITSIESSKSELWIKYLPLDAATPELCPSTCTWKRIRKVIFPVEILFLLSIFCYFFFNQIYEQYIFQHLAHIALHVGHNLTKRQFCYNQTYFANETCFQNFQEHVNTVNMAIAILYLSLTGIASLVLGPLSDVIGRKRALFWSILGIVLCSFFQLFVIHFELNPYTYSIGAFMFGSFGGHAALIGLAFAAVADVTSSKRCLTLRMGLLEACITVGQATGSAALNNWIQQDNCNFSPPVWLMFLIAVTAIVYVCLMTEPTTGRREEYGHDRNNMKQILNGFKCFLVPGYIGIRKWWRLWAATGIILLECLTIIGGNEIITYYLHNKPLEWSYGKIGVYEPVVNLAKGLSLIILLPLLLALKFSNGLLCLTAALFAVATNIIMATIQTDWAMYLGELYTCMTIM